MQYKNPTPPIYNTGWDLMQYTTRAVTAAMRDFQYSCVSLTGLDGDCILMPGLYLVLGSTAIGKSTWIRQLDSALARDDKLTSVVLRSGEPEYFGSQWLDDLQSLINGAVPGHTISESSSLRKVGTVWTWDSLAFLSLFETPRRTKTVDGDSASKAEAARASIAAMLRTVASGSVLVPNTAAASGGVPGTYLLTLAAIHATLAQRGDYCFAVVNPLLADTPEFRAAVSGVVAGSIELDKQRGATLTRIVTRVKDGKDTRFSLSRGVTNVAVEDSVQSMADVFDALTGGF